MLGREKAPGGDTDQVGGTFHYHFIYEYFHRRMPYPEARIDAVLALQAENDNWSGGRSWWMALDALYLLTRTARHHPYRVDDIRDATRAVTEVYRDKALDAAFRDEHLDHFAVHNVTAIISIFAEAQQFLGNTEVITEWPLQLVLDKRPFI